MDYLVKEIIPLLVIDFLYRNLRRTRKLLTSLQSVAIALALIVVLALSVAVSIPKEKAHQGFLLTNPKLYKT